MRRLQNRLRLWEIDLNVNRQGFMRHPSDHHIDEVKFRNFSRQYDLWFISEGEAFIESLEGEVFVLRRGSLVLHRSTVFRRLWQQKGAGRLAVNWFHFTLQTISGNRKVPFREVADFPLVGACSNPDMAELICAQILHFGLLRKAQSRPRRSLEHVTASQMLKVLLFELLNQPYAEKVPDAAIRNIRRHREILGMAESIELDPSLFVNVADMAGSLNLSPTHFARVFSEVIGKAPMIALIEARIRKAKQFLYGSDLTINQIANELGYRNTYFFCRQFKKETGMTPVQFRTQN
ncbi:MAG TPA: AraC family transcriptional regulator [Chthoniobacteraceae bacterium]|nr:AraC family transcriptional regulator [Chthoniobacteraceae bacterium]